ncbi:MAG: hypothetical protein ACR2KK_14585 [Acidimicrobiales bacterium]
MPTAAINTLAGSFYIEDPGSTIEKQDFGIWRNGIVQPQSPSAASVPCGTRDRPAEVTLEILGQPPGDPAPVWEAVAEVSLVSVSGRLWIRDWDGRLTPDLDIDGLPIGPIRLRVSAEGRDTQERERFLIQAWSAPEAPDDVLRQDRLAGDFQ